jgi:hypothetical protein
MNFCFEDVRYTQIRYLENSITKIRHSIETPVGTITAVTRINPLEVKLLRGGYEEHFVKEPSDWRVISFILKNILDNLSPNYEAFEREEDELGDTGVCYARIEKTPFQRAWVELASLERAAIDFKEKPEELLEFIKIQRQLHMRQAEIAAESPAKFIDILEHITNIISPKYYREYCIPIYEMYSKALEGTGKVLGAHMDGRFGHLKQEIGESHLKVIESFTVPPVGDVSLTEAKALWPDKILFVNCPPHVNNGTPEQVKDAYTAISEQWGGRKGLLIEHSEDIPLDKVEMNLSTALDVFGY